MGRGQTDTHTRTHFHTVNRPGLRAGSIENLLETEHQCTFVYIMNFTNFYPFLAFLMLCGRVSIIFTIFFSGLELCLETCDSYGNFGYLKKDQTFLF